VEARAAALTEEAFGALVDRWYGSTVRLARLLAPDQATAQQASREAWLAAIERPAELDGGLAHLVVLRATIESLAARVDAGASEREAAVDPQRFEAEGHRWAGWWTDAGAPQERERNASDEALVRALAELDPATAAIVTLRDVERLSPHEVELRARPHPGGPARSAHEESRRVVGGARVNELALTCAGLTDLVTDYLDRSLDPQRADVRDARRLLSGMPRVPRADPRDRRALALASSRAGCAGRARRTRRRVSERRVIAYKFLRAGRIGPFSGEAWPADGPVEASGLLEACRNGVHGCRVGDLPYWLDDELWEIELSGDVLEDRLKLVARGGRLVRRVDAWNDATRRAFAEWCLRRVARHSAAELRDAGLESEAEALESAATPNDVAAAAAPAAAAAQRAGLANAERLGSYAADAVEWTKSLPPSGVAYVAAHTADARSRAESADAFASERVLQAQWLAEHLGLAS
jgi:DNA-directed RNA polymerase specialized sigma24 family protein